MVRSTLSTRVVEAIADHSGVSPAEVEPVLYRVVEPDALDRLFRPLATGKPRSDGFVTFGYGNLAVRVTADGTVSIVDDDGLTRQSRGDRRSRTERLR